MQEQELSLSSTSVFFFNILLIDQSKLLRPTSTLLVVGFFVCCFTEIFTTEFPPVIGPCTLIPLFSFLIFNI